MIVVSQQAALAGRIDDLLLIAECSDGNEWDGRV